MQLTNHDAKFQSAIRSVVIAFSSSAATAGYLTADDAAAVQSSVDVLTQPEVWGSVLTLLMTLWGIFDPNKKQGKGDPG